MVLSMVRATPALVVSRMLGHRGLRMTLEFDAATHTYALGGKVLPSVSQIIQADGKLSEWMDKINPDVLAAKSANGTNVHDYLARWDSTEGMEEYAPFAGYLGAWLKFKNEHMPAGNGSYIEIPLAHPTLQFAGTPDRVYFNRETKSRIIVAEYTDPECPFCIRQAKDGIMPKLLESYAGKVRVAHKPFRAVPHPGAEPKAIALLCVGKIAGAEAYNAYYDAMMDRSTQEKVMPVDSLASLAKELKIDEKAFSACYDGKDTLAQYDVNTTEGRKYGVEGTPGTLVIDSETGKYELIAGAYPYESFQAAVDKLLK